jgi:G:T/U-mismatch repair DNA glycosylase
LIHAEPAVGSFTPVRIEISVVLPVYFRTVSQATAESTPTAAAHRKTKKTDLQDTRDEDITSAVRSEKAKAFAATNRERNTLESMLLAVGLETKPSRKQLSVNEDKQLHRVQQFTIRKKNAICTSKRDQTRQDRTFFMSRITMAVSGSVSPAATRRRSSATSGSSSSAAAAAAPTAVVVVPIAAALSVSRLNSGRRSESVPGGWPRARQQRAQARRSAVKQNSRPRSRA